MNQKREIELTNTRDDEDISVETIDEPVLTRQNLRERKIKKENNKEQYDKLTEKEMTNLVHSYDPPQIRDWPKRPYRTIFIVFLLLISGILFLGMSYHKYTNNHTYDVYLPYGVLGFLLMFPGVYYTFILVNILLDREGYDYSELPDLNES